MLIEVKDIAKIFADNNIVPTGVLHVGAHECEEMQVYNTLGLSASDIIWIDAILQKVIQAQNRAIPNVYNAVVADKDDELIAFNIANNYQSSSILEMGTHLQEHPGITYVGQIHQPSITLDTFFARNNLDASKYNFWNFDIQGAELMALKGAVNSIQYASAIYLEVNEKELYKNCALIADIDDFLAKYGFKRIATNMTHHGWGDALYIRELTR